MVTYCRSMVFFAVRRSALLGMWKLLIYLLWYLHALQLKDDTGMKTSVLIQSGILEFSISLSILSCRPFGACYLVSLTRGVTHGYVFSALRASRRAKRLFALHKSKSTLQTCYDFHLCHSIPFNPPPAGGQLLTLCFCYPFWLQGKNKMLP